MLCTFARLMRLERALRSVRRPECDRPATVSGSVRFSGESARKVIPLQATVVWECYSLASYRLLD